MSAALTLHDNLDAMVASYERSRDLIVEGFAAIEAARQEFAAHFALGGDSADRLSIYAYRNSHHPIDDSPEHALVELRRKAWSVIVDRLELKRVMSVERWCELQQQLEKEELPEITHDSVRRFGATHINPRSLETMMKEAIAEVYKWLRPGEYGLARYKRASRWEVPERIALSYVVESHWDGGLRVRFGSGGKSDDRQMMLALENVFSWLDGKGQVAKSHKSELEQAIEGCRPGVLGTTELVEFRAYKNRSLHLRFRRLDLLKRLNEIAGGLNMRGDEHGDTDLARSESA